LEIVDLEVTTEGDRTDTHSGSRRERFSDCMSRKLRAPNEVRTNGADRRLVFDS